MLKNRLILEITLCLFIAPFVQAEPASFHPNACYNHKVFSRLLELKKEKGLVENPDENNYQLTYQGQDLIKCNVRWNEKGSEKEWRVCDDRFVYDEQTHQNKFVIYDCQFNFSKIQGEAAKLVTQFVNVYYDLEGKDFGGLIIGNKQIPVTQAEWNDLVLKDQPIPREITYLTCSEEPGSCEIKFDVGGYRRSAVFGKP